MQIEHELCLESDIAVGAMKSFQVNGKTILVANIGGTFYAMDDTCPHQQYSLSSDQGLEETTVTCGWHGAQFDCATGKFLTFPPDPSKKFPDFLPYKINKKSGKLFLEL